MGSLADLGKMRREALRPGQTAALENPKIVRMKSAKDADAKAGSGHGLDAPLTLEGFAVLHQMFRVRRDLLRKLDAASRTLVADEAAALIERMEGGEAGQSAAFEEIGNKGDLILLHFRQSLEQLAQAQLEIAALPLSDFLEPAGSYLSVIEIGLYEATVRLRAEMTGKAIDPSSPEGEALAGAEVARWRERLQARLSPEIPRRHYLCFYPMNKRRGEHLNWYRLAVGERARLMHDHGLIGRRYAGQVTQVISGSVGLDDWEWGVDLFADDPLVFKKLVYEMRFDESSADYAEFGPFRVGIRLDAARMRKLLDPWGNTPAS